MKLFFRLGINPNLSLAEIQSYLDFAGLDYSMVTASKEVAIMEIKKIDKVDLVAGLIKQLGGTVKVGVILGEVPVNNVKNEVRNLVKEELKLIDAKKFYGFSLVGNYQKDFKNVGDLNRFALDIKGEMDISARVVSSKEIELSSVIVQKEKLLRRGGDFNIIYINDQVFLGKTIAVQEFEEYGYRDYSRPGIDAKSGMLPPKLAKMMINLAQVKNDATVLDPFCGSGTVVSELLLKGFEKIIGSDNSPKAIADSKTNIAWFAEKFHFDISQVQLLEADVNNLADKVVSGSVGAVITEPYLGPALKGVETKERLFVIKRELETLYRSAFTSLSVLIEKGGSLVIVVPAFVHHDEIIYLDILEDLEKCGFVIKSGFENIENHSFHYPLVYRRSGQKLYREIIVARKSS